MLKMKGMRFPKEIILLCIRWYAAYGSVALSDFCQKMALILLNNFCWELLNATEPWTRRYLHDGELTAAQLPPRVPTNKKPIVKPLHW